MKSRPQSWVVDFIIWFSFGLTGLFLTFTYNDPISLYKFGANSWPAVINILIIVCITVYAVSNYLKKSGIAEDENEKNPMRFKEIVSASAIPSLYVFSLRYIGFYAGTLIFIPLYTYSIHRKDLKKILYICIPVACVIEILFTKFLFVPFPVGILPLFYDFNTAVVGWLY